MAERRSDDAVKVGREQQLLDHATQLFSGGGFQQTGLQAIADALGITRPLFYYYFSSKEDLLWRIVGHLGEDLLVASEPIPKSDASPAEKLEQIIHLLIEKILGNMDAFRVYFADYHRLEGERLRSIRRSERAYQDRVVNIIREGQEAGDFRPGNPRVLARFVLGMARSVTAWHKADSSVSVTDISALGGELARSAVTVGT